MPSQSAFSRRLVGSLSTLALVCVSHFALADDKAECSAAYDKAQSLRHDEKLQAARQQAVSCTREMCAEFIRTDCVKWLGEIDQSQPTIVFEVHDTHGRETRNVQVELDGKPWLDKVDGGAKAIDPGQHKLHYVIEGHAPIDDTVEIHEGEKNRRLVASFAKAGGDDTPMLPKKGGVSPPPETPSSSRSPAPWIIGGVGVAALVAGAVTGGLVLHYKSEIEKNCNPTTKACASGTDGVSSARAGQVLGPVSTVALVIGGIGTSVGAIWLIARPRARADLPPRPALAVGPNVSAGGASWRIEGIW